MISFLSPLFLAGAAAVAIPIAIHLFYKRAEPLVDFAVFTAGAFLAGALVAVRFTG